ncbi:hypothetical protein MKEN_00777200 [Mycena kentingensis (nom. inval.)]|nr:hypothetical protein MKEN_00777200 [Mycena kentingensis (nom. inval.)]
MVWCTRWYLGLLLLPLPTAPPYFLTLFLAALFIQAKPWCGAFNREGSPLIVLCSFYCIVLLIALFFSSCYWQPFPTSTTLSTPWTENVTTFAEALNRSLPSTYEGPLPPLVRTLDRCWCDIWTGGFFEPYNVTRWEESSILKLATELEAAQKKTEDVPAVSETETRTATAPATNAEAESSLVPSIPKTAVSQFPIRTTLARAKEVVHGLWKHVHWPRREPVLVVIPEPPEKLPLLRSEYDLRPYGLELILDFSWRS